MSSDFLNSKKKILVGIKDTTCSVKNALLLLNQKSIYFVCLSLANLFYLVVCDCSIQRLVMTSQTKKKFKSRHSNEMNKLSMKVSLRKRELLPDITLVRDNQLACYRWLYMYVFFKVSWFKCHGRMNVYIRHDPYVLRFTPARNQLLIIWFGI